MDHLLFRHMLAELEAEALSGNAQYARQAQRDLLVAKFVKSSIKDFDKLADKEEAAEKAAIAKRKD